ncbi:HemK-related putative methylase [Archaeoglobus sulfaticallidus PM70-1]|uniref:HemK-related putative methylase n=1 Tax=Archaeoglobus sulfaticallidus PM70-1 TaxID=387631 RepID=N0BE39_9EURY|nr:HemK2/MTQ2 family protein methyltransferase [Archaeoglobus sulfaticallidus]AGK60482.1 HemK-related putative methylase [Archaeoglobus sulfaticallidus PM70-1]
MDDYSKVYPVLEDTELLLEAALKEVKKDDIVLEVGTGSGYVAKNVKDRCKFLVASDISPYAVRVAHNQGLNAVRGDLLTCFKKKFTLILFNPPYVELDEKELTGDWLDLALHGGEKGVDVMRRFLSQLDDALVDGGRAVMTFSSYNTPDVYEILDKSGFSFEVISTKKLFFEMLYAVRIFKES